MKLNNEQDILNLIKEDPWMRSVISTAKTLNLPDWWVCAGFVRTKIWDTLHGYKERTPLEDVDVVYFDPQHIDESLEKEYERRLHEILPDIPWSVKNEARMHMRNGDEPYSSAEDAISKFPETVTALGVKLNDRNELVLTAPHGLSDVIRLEVQPTPLFMEGEKRLRLYEERLTKKKWHEKWPLVTYKSSITNTL